MRILILISILFSATLIADDDIYIYRHFLKVKNGNRCVYGLHPKGNKGQQGWCYYNSDDDKEVCDRELDRDDFIGGYSYEDDECKLNPMSENTGIYWENISFFFALSGNLVGFLTLFLVLYLTNLLVRK